MMNNQALSHYKLMKSDLCDFSYTRSRNFKTMDFHSHDDLEIYIFADGYITYYIEENTYNLVPGDILIIPPECMHRPVVSKENELYERFVFNISLDRLKEISAPEFNFYEVFKNMNNKNRVKLSDEKQKHLFSLLYEIYEEASLNRPGKNVVKTANTMLVLAEIMRAIDMGAAMPPTKADNTIPQVIMYINAHLQEKINLDSLASVFYVSKYHMLREFKKYTNSSIYDYIINKRVTYAKSLISKGELLSDAAVKSGFSDYSTFYKNFVSKTGMTPKEYKKNFQA